MTYAIGAAARLAFKKEVTYGTNPGGTDFLQMPFIPPMRFGADQALIDSNVIGIGPTRDPSDPFYDGINVPINFAVPLDKTELGRWLQLLCGAPTTTGSATAIALIYPELKGKLNGHAVRAPVLNASLTDCVFEMQRETSAEEVNALFAAAAQGPLAGILGYEERPLVSVDYARDTRSSIVDALSTMVTDGTLLKVYAWYDNEMGYACRMVDLACHMNEVGI